MGGAVGSHERVSALSRVRRWLAWAISCAAVLPFIVYLVLTVIQNTLDDE